MIHDDLSTAAHAPGEGKRLRRAVARDAIPVDLVSAFAGDRPMTDAESARIRDLGNRNGPALYSDLLFVVSHCYFAPDVAADLWHLLLAHKFRMSERLGRNVRMTVATLDYLSNIAGAETSFTLMSEARVAEIVTGSMRDGMTGLFNNTTFHELLEVELERHRRSGLDMGLILLDIDDFKSINDRFGHPEGDRVIVALAGILRNETREADLCCRIGGEEFAVILPVIDSREATRMAERITRGSREIKSEGRALTISAGVATCEGPNQTATNLVQRADQALYQAKRAGKNRVATSGGDSGRVATHPKPA